MKTLSFSKKLLIADYSIFVILVICAAIFQSVDFASVLVAWVVQLGISSAAYYWKAKNENRVKVPILVIKSLPPEIRDQVDLTQIVTAIIQSE
jgi:hypothetical protein